MTPTAARIGVRTSVWCMSWARSLISLMRLSSKYRKANHLTTIQLPVPPLVMRLSSPMLSILSLTAIPWKASSVTMVPTSLVLLAIFAGCLLGTLLSLGMLPKKTFSLKIPLSPSCLSRLLLGLFLKVLLHLPPWWKSWETFLGVAMSVPVKQLLR